MWSSGSLDFESVGLALDRQPMLEPPSQFHPSPYTFTKLENGKKKATDATCVTPPSWLLLDHTIAVIWSIFNLDPTLPQLSIDDLKWAYEFLKSIKNQKGENPPDVKVCLKEIQDRLINLYAKLTSFKSEDFEAIDNAFGEKIIEGSTSSYLTSSYFSNDVESKFDDLSLSSKNQMSLASRTSSRDRLKDILKEAREREEVSTSKGKAAALAGRVGGHEAFGTEPTWKRFVVESELVKLNPSEDFPLLGEDSDQCEGAETGDDEEVQKYVLSLFEHEKKEEALRAKTSAKSLIPTPRKGAPLSVPEVVTTKDATYRVTKKEKKTSKKVHCIAQMRSLQFQKSMKVKHTTGEQAAYSKVKAEILTINPDMSKEGVMKFVKEWRSEKVNELHTEHKKLSSFEEYMKSLNKELKPAFEMNSQLSLNPEVCPVKRLRPRRTSPEKHPKTPLSRNKN